MKHDAFTKSLEALDLQGCILLQNIIAQRILTLYLESKPPAVVSAEEDLKKSKLLLPNNKLVL